MRPDHFNHDHLKLSVVNLLATAIQESVVHPYAPVRKKAEEALPVLRKVQELLPPDVKKKNDALKFLAHLYQPDIGEGGALSLSLLRQAINRDKLDKESRVESIVVARKRYLNGLAAASLVKDEQSVARWQWFRKSLDSLEGTSLSVNYLTLWELSGVGVLHKWVERGGGE